MITGLIIYYLLLFNTIPVTVHGVPLSQFIDFGSNSNGLDLAVTNNDDFRWDVDCSQVPMLIAGKTYSRLIVSNDGPLLFSNKLTSDKTYSVFSSSPPSSWPLPSLLERGSPPFITAFWSDVDTSGTGTVYSRYSTSDTNANNKVKNIVETHFTNKSTNSNFTPTAVIVVTWDHVGYYDMGTDKTNTFQCIVATNGTDTYAIFLYLDDGINWSMPDSDYGEELGGLAVGVQLSTYNFRLNLSLTDGVIKVDELSNVGEPGMFIFHISTAPPPPSCLSCKEKIIYSACSMILEEHNNDESAIPVSCQTILQGTT